MDDTPSPIMVSLNRELSDDTDYDVGAIYWPRLGLYAVCVITLLAFSNRLFWWTDIMAQFRLHYVLLLLVLGGYFIVRQRPRLVVMAVMGIMINLAAVATAMPMINTNAAQAGSLPEGKYTVVSYNVSSENPDPKVILPWLHELKPDMAVLVEANRSWQPIFDQVGDILPYQTVLHSSMDYGIAILSRLPLDKTRTDTAGTQDLPVLSTEVESPMGRLCVIAAHPNKPYGAEDTMARNLYLAQVAAMAQTRGQVCMIVGDFNATPWSAGFDALRILPNLQPSVWHAPATWPAMLGGFGLPLDHILLTMPVGMERPVQITKVSAGKVLSGSSHRPIIGVLETR